MSNEQYHNFIPLSKTSITKTERKKLKSFILRLLGAGIVSFGLLTIGTSTFTIRPSFGWTVVKLSLVFIVVFANVGFNWVVLINGDVTNAGFLEVL